MPADSPVGVHRADLQTLTRLAKRDLAIIWKRIIFNPDPVAVRNNLIEILHPLIQVYGQAAATLGADYYDEVRTAAAIDGKFTSVAAELPDHSDRIDRLSRWAVGPLFSDEPDDAAALLNASGGMQDLIWSADRQSIMDSSYDDPRAHGWQRVADGGCAFCEMLAGRGAVYSESSADFASHSNCECTAEPAFEGETRPVQRYTPSDRVATDADRTRVRDWIADNQ